MRKLGIFAHFSRPYHLKPCILNVTWEFSREGSSELEKQETEHWVSGREICLLRKLLNIKYLFTGCATLLTVTRSVLWDIKAPYAYLQWMDITVWQPSLVISTSRGGTSFCSPLECPNFWNKNHGWQLLLLRRMKRSFVQEIQFSSVSQDWMS